MEVYGVVYLIRNKVNGKRYVGQTVQPLKKRMQKHLRDDLYVDRAIRSYGIENFYCGVIKTCATKEELDEAEKHFIAVLHSKAPYGYNLTDGGCGDRHTDETRAKLSAANSGENNPMFGKKHTPETRAKLSAAQLGNKKKFGQAPFGGNIGENVCGEEWQKQSHVWKKAYTRNLRETFGDTQRRESSSVRSTSFARILLKDFDCESRLQSVQKFGCGN
ncbi:MAG: GIY-YIG nuclease family protein [Selenomonadaceae bacterium]|nr:GIY-YIG nuclease family protein [Selenomonadaceae bacterium]